MKPKISVVIPTYHRPMLLKRCIDALANQSIGKNHFEIIVVSDGLDSNTKDIIAKIKTQEKINLFFYALPKHKGPAAARNLGVKKTTTEYIAFTDDDCIPDSSWLAYGLEMFEKGHHAFAGKIIVPIPQNPTDADISLSHLETASFVTANAFCTKKLFQNVGGFSEEFTLAWREDSDLEFKIREAGYFVASTKRAVVIHPPKPTFWGISVFEQKKAMFNALLYKKHKNLYKKYIQPLPPLHYYAIVISAICFISSLFIKNNALVFFSVFFWTYLTVRFMIKRIKPVQKSFVHISDIVVSSILIPPFAIFWRLKGAFSYKVFFI
jgi:glycosyltransferase involved in cell wall biosynthesis